MTHSLELLVPRGRVPLVLAACRVGGHLFADSSAFGILDELEDFSICSGCGTVGEGAGRVMGGL